MKKLLYDTLLNKCYLGTCLNDSLDDRDCDVILDFLEEVGMLPPVSFGAHLEADMQYADEVTEEYCKWEPEDEN